MNYRQGAINPETGLVFWSRQASCKDGMRWMTAEKFAKKRAAITTCQKLPRYRERMKLLRNTNAGRAKRNTYAKTWRSTAAHKEKARAYARRRRAEDHLACLADRARIRIGEALRKRGFGKRSSSNKILGCDWPALKTHIESLFQYGMNWSNRNLWHIDHRKPLASATTEAELLVLCHYTNLRPLWARDNQSKGCKLEQ